LAEEDMRLTGKRGKKKEEERMANDPYVQNRGSGMVGNLRLFALHMSPPKPKYYIEARAKHIPDLLFRFCIWCLSLLWWDWGLNSGFKDCKAVSLPLEPHLQCTLLW
jgi:hypothetical protein